MASFVRIALAGAGNYAEVNIVEGDTVSRLADRASSKFPHWGTADRLTLYLVAAGGKDTPSASAVDCARHLDQIGWSLKDAGVSSGAWLVARRVADGEAAVAAAAPPPSGGAFSLAYWLAAVSHFFAETEDVVVPAHKSWWSPPSPGRAKLWGGWHLREGEEVKEE